MWFTMSRVEAEGRRMHEVTNSVSRAISRWWKRPVVVMLAAAGWIACLGTTAHADELLVTSFFSDRVSRYDLATGAFLGSLDPAAGLNNPLSTRLGPDGRLYVASEGNNSIMRFNVDGSYIDTFVPSGSGGLNGPTGMTWGPDGNMYVPSFNTASILKYNGVDGSFMGVAVASGAGGLSGPDNGTTFGPDGNLYVPSYWNNRVLKFSASGDPLGTFITSVGRPRVLDFQADGLYVSSETLDTVRRYDATTGAFIENFITPRDGGLDTPTGFVFGPDGYLYVASSTTDQILRYNAVTGDFVGVFASALPGGIDGPVFLTIIPAPSGGAILAVGVIMTTLRGRRLP